MTSAPFCENYFENILKSNLNPSDDVKVKNIEISPCNAAGDGFLSVLKRVNIEYEVNSTTSTTSFILKCETTNEFSLQKIGKNGFDVQTREIKFYQQISPKMMKIFEKFAEKSKIIPKLIAIDKINKILIIEDLCRLNFTTGNRKIGLNENEMKISLQNLAKFHSASLMILSKDPHAFDEFNVGMYDRNVTVFKNAQMNFFDAAANEISTWKGCEKYGEKMMKMKVNFFENAVKCFDVQSRELNVLNHGDVWTTNLMFQHENDGGCLKDAVLIDFQFCHFASAALDLHHFLFTSLSDDIFTPGKVEEFLQFYYYNLRSNLTELNYNFENFPSLHDFTIEFQRKMIYGFSYAITILPLMTGDDPDNDFIAHHSDDARSREFRKRIMKSQRYEAIARRLLPYYDAMGILDL